MTPVAASQETTSNSRFVRRSTPWGVSAGSLKPRGLSLSVRTVSRVGMVQLPFNVARCKTEAKQGSDDPPAPARTDPRASANAISSDTHGADQGQSGRAIKKVVWTIKDQRVRAQPAIE